MDRKLKLEELRQININEGHYKDIIIKGKTGLIVKERIEWFGGAAYTPKKK